MLFNSWIFIIFFLPIVFVVYFGLARLRYIELARVWLAIASIGFYAYWNVAYVPLLIGSICWNYLWGRIIAYGKRPKVMLAIAILGNLALLGYYKYTGFFVTTINDMTGFAYEVPHIILPLGISFFTFTQTAYLVDVYRGETKIAGETFPAYLLFVTIFPHLIAGPIINYRDMLPQFYRLRNFVINYRNLSLGISLFSMGLFKKVYIADNLSPWVSAVFNNASDASFAEAWAGALAYTYQLYFDFSGYSEMAIGLGLMFNLQFPTNFNSPYQSKSIIDFWRRWHMALGSWVKNYLYIPMGGNRQGELCKMRNLFVSMLLIGLWHGAGWTFVLWGGLHGLFLMINHQWRRLEKKLPSIMAWSITFLCVVIGWVFFRAVSFADGWSIIVAMFGGSGVTWNAWHISTDVRKVVKILLLLTVVLAFMPNPQIIIHKFKPNKIWWVTTLAILIWAMLHFNQYSEFLYFQF